MADRSSESGLSEGNGMSRALYKFSKMSFSWFPRFLFGLDLAELLAEDGTNKGWRICCLNRFTVMKLFTEFFLFDGYKISLFMLNAGLDGRLDFRVDDGVDAWVDTEVGVSIDVDN